MIVITVASGRTGRIAAEALLAKGEKVRAIARRAETLAPLVQMGAEAFLGNVEDAASMIKAFDGATAVYLVFPQSAEHEDLHAVEDRITAYYCAAIAAARVPHAVTLSGIGAQHAANTGPIVGLHRLEQALNRIPGLNVLHLRPVHFMENLLMSIEPMRMMGALPGPAPADLPMPYIATRDIGAYAAERLHARDFSASSTQELLGPRDYSMKEIAAILAAAIGKPGLKYMQVPMTMIEMGMTQMGMPKPMAALMVEMFEAGNKGLLNPQELRSPENTTPTTLEWFATEVFAPAYQRKSAGA